MLKIISKDKNKLQAMLEGGRILSAIRERAIKSIKPGTKGIEIEKLVMDDIGRSGGQPSFLMVPGYHYATCININNGIVHGIPNEYEMKKGDLVTVDLGLYYKGFHTDTADTIIVGGFPAENKERFLNVGRQALENAIKKVAAGNRISAITLAIQETVEKGGYACSRVLTGHGVGKNLHEDPPIPCVFSGRIDESPKMKEGQTLAIEVIYSEGSPKINIEDDGWTIVTADGSLAAVFEKTVLVTKNKAVILTN
jgi:methionyl aminopeptidase